MGIRRKWVGMMTVGLGVAAIGAAPAVPVGGDTQPVATQPAVAAGVDEGRWKGVVEQLGSGDFAVRESAQKELDRATWRETGLLKKLAEGTRDEEAKARILKRVEEIEEKLAVDPPPISVELKNAPLSTVLEELKKVTGEDIAGFENGRVQAWTLSAKDKPFWDVFMMLSKQHGLSLQAYDDFRISPSDPGLLNCTAVGGVAIFPQSITASRTVNLQRPPEDRNSKNVNLSLMVAIDPRIKLAGNSVQVSEVVDDKGNILFAQDARRIIMSSGRPQSIMQMGTSLKMPENPGKMISVKGEVRMVLRLAEARVDVEAVDTKQKQPLAIGDKTITFDRFDLGENRLDMMIVAKSPPQQGNIQQPQTGVGVQVFDATGRRIWQANVQGSYSVGLGGSQYVKPFKAVLTVPTKTKEATVPFELKELPLPE